MDRVMLDALHSGIHNRQPVSGLTHDFYRYPARFSPAFARAVINAFTAPGDVVLDPFMGGGTTLVEALASGRNAIGTDISSLARFIARAKLDTLSNLDLNAVQRWTHDLIPRLNLHRPAKRDTPWLPYQRNISDRMTWPLRKLIEFTLAEIPRLSTERRKRFARMMLLKTSQWALDCRSVIPTADRFREELLENLRALTLGTHTLRTAVSTATLRANGVRPRTLILTCQASELANHARARAMRPPALVLTSPPYPGVHVMYHRWQVLGRKETPAPFWIADSLDGNGLSHYTFGDRNRRDLAPYFRGIELGFRSVTHLATRDTVFVQMVAFSKPESQLHAYLDALSRAGLVEVTIPALTNADDKRVWRRVPNRKWYADQRGSIAASNEVVLFHRRR